MWKMCFSSEGCVAYARRCEAKALRAIFAFCHTLPSIPRQSHRETHSAPLSHSSTTAQMPIEPPSRDPRTLSLSHQNPPAESLPQPQLREGDLHYLQQFHWSFAPGPI